MRNKPLRGVFQVKQEDECGCEAEEKGAEYNGGVYGAFPSSLHLISSSKTTHIGAMTWI